MWHIFMYWSEIFLTPIAFDACKGASCSISSTSCGGGGRLGAAPLSIAGE